MSQTTTVEITTTSPFYSVFQRRSLPSDLPGMTSGFIDLLAAIAGGCTPASIIVQAAGTAAAQASGTLTISSGSGTVGGSINGVAITVTWGTSDTATAAALAAAINASTNALVKGIVTAKAASGVVTITSVDATKTANAITLAASGTGVTASGARLTGGAGSDVAGVSYSKL